MAFKPSKVVSLEEKEKELTDIQIKKQQEEEATTKEKIAIEEERAYRRGV